MIIEKIYRCRIDWDVDAEAADAAWVKECDRAEAAGEEFPEHHSHWEEAEKKIDEALRKYGDLIDYTNTGAGPCWGAYIILEGISEATVHDAALDVIGAITSVPFATVLEDE